MSTPITQETPQAQIVRIAFVGAVFSGLGAVLNLYVPAFHKPTQLLQEKLDGLNGMLAKHVHAKCLFEGNPLTGNSKLTQFLAINAMETPFIAGTMVSLGALAKAIGIKSIQR